MDILLLTGVFSAGAAFGAVLATALRPKPKRVEPYFAYVPFDEPTPKRVILD